MHSFLDDWGITQSELSRWHVTPPKNYLRFEPSLIEALQQLRSMLISTRPLEISKSLCSTWFSFTDGVYEPDSINPSTLGGVLISPCGIATECFGEAIHDSLTTDLLAESKHPIYELEVLPPLLAAQIWGRYVTGAPVVSFWITMMREQPIFKALEQPTWLNFFTKQFVDIECSLKGLSWFGRVPSHIILSTDPPVLTLATLCWETAKERGSNFQYTLVNRGWLRVYWKQLPENIRSPAYNPETFPQCPRQKVALTGIIGSIIFPRSFRLVQFVVAVMSFSHVGVFTFSFFGDATT